MDTLLGYIWRSELLGKLLPPVTALLLASPTSAQEFTPFPKTLANFPVHVSVFRDETEGCWGGAQAVSDVFELSLRQSGVQVVSGRIDPDQLTLEIEAFAIRSESNLCAGTIQFRLVHYFGEEFSDGVWVSYKMIQQKYAVAMGPNDLDGQFLEAAEQVATNFSNAILKARGN